MNCVAALGAFAEQLWAHLKDSPAWPAHALKPSCMALRVRETVQSFVLPRLQTISIAGSSTSRDLAGLLTFRDVSPGNGTQESRVLCVHLLCHTHLIFFFVKNPVFLILFSASASSWLIRHFVTYYIVPIIAEIGLWPG